MLIWKDITPPWSVDAVACNLWEFEDTLSTSLISTVEELSDKLSKEFQQFKEDMFYCPPLQSHANDSNRWLKREDLEGTHHGIPFGFSRETTEGAWRIWMEDLPWP